MSPGSVVFNLAIAFHRSFMPIFVEKLGIEGDRCFGAD